jgi:hypothetical protein
MPAKRRKEKRMEFSIQKDKWTLDDIKIALADLLDNGNISVSEKNIGDLPLLDEQFFSKRKVSLSISVSDSKSPFPNEFLDALSKMKNLKSLHINTYAKQDMSALSALKIEALAIRPETAIEAGFLSGLSSLKELTIMDGTLKSCKPIGDLKSLKRLHLSDVKKMDCEFGARLKIEELILHNPRGCIHENSLYVESMKSLALLRIPALVDLSFLAPCKKLEDLTLVELKNVSSLSGIADPKSLIRLCIQDMVNLSDFSALAGAVNLEELIIKWERGTKAISSQTNIKELGKNLLTLPKLKVLNIGHMLNKAQSILTQMFTDAGKGSVIQ